MIKKYLLTGLAVLLPAIITIFIISFVVDLLTKPFIGIVTSLFHSLGFFDKPFLYLSGEQTLVLVSKLLVLVLLFLIILLVGFIAQLFLAKYLGEIGDSFMQRIPIVNKFYNASKEVVSTVFSGKKSFVSVVLAPFPYPGMRALGIVTQERLPEGSEAESDLVSVFIPGAPTPIGYMILFPKKDLIYLDMKVDDAFKFFVSFGVVRPDFVTASKTEPAPEKDISGI